MEQAIDIGGRRELFVDKLLIDKMRKASLHLHEPQPRNVVLRHDMPWEGTACGYHTIVRDGDRLLMYYRGWHVCGGTVDRNPHPVYCVAESRDGIAFERPNLGLHAWEGSKDNNIILTEITHIFRNKDLTRIMHGLVSGYQGNILKNTTSRKFMQKLFSREDTPDV